MGIVPSNDLTTTQALAELSGLPEHEWAIVDFDRTLFCQNSTELFFAQAQPNAMAMAIVSCARGLAYWYYADERKVAAAHADPWAIVAVCTLMPWAWVRWRWWQARRLRGELNLQLVSALATRKPSRVLVASLGCGFLIKPLLSGLPRYHLSLAPFLRAGAYRVAGKLSHVQQRLSPCELAAAWGAGDSDDDRQWLDACRRGHLRQWSEVPMRCAFHSTYLPLAYATFCKYPKRAYFLRSFLGEDVVVACLAVFWPLVHSWEGWLAGFLGMYSFFAIYELGYVENDTTARELEGNPASKSVHRHAVPRGIWPWVWSFSGAVALSWVVGQTLGSSVAWQWMAFWLLWMLATRLLFFRFNRSLPANRTGYFAALQLVKSGGLFLWFGGTFVGVALIVSQILRQHTNYLIYRYRGDNRPFFRQRYRAVVFSGACMLGLAGGTWTWQDNRWQLLTIAAWLAARVYFEAKRFARFGVESRYADFLNGKTQERPGE